MIFVHRQVESLVSLGIAVRTFYVGSRTSPLALARDWLRIQREIRRYRPHILHSHYGSVTALLCSLATRRPLVITFRGSDLNPESDVSCIRSRIGCVASQIAALRAKRIVCVSNRLRHQLWWRDDCASTLSDGIDLDLFRPMPKAEARSLLGWDPHQRVVLFNESGRPGLKGRDLIDSSLRLASERVGSVRLELLDGYVAPEQVAIRINAADCIGLASKCEGSPNIVKEALACNVPVVSVDVGDVVERVNGVYPSRVVGRNVVEFADALVEVLTASSRCNGREAVGELGLDNVARHLAALYAEVVASPSRAHSALAEVKQMSSQ